MISPRGIVVAALLTAFAAGNAATAADASRTTPVDSVVATAKVREVAVYRRRGDRRPFRILQSPTEKGGPLVFIVRHRAAGWEETAKRWP